MENEQQNNENMPDTDSEDNAGNVLHQPVEHHSSTGLMIGVLVLVLIVILGGLYLWGNSLKTTPGTTTTTTEPTRSGPTTEIPNNEPETDRAEADIQALETMSTSDELSAIEADLDATLLDLDVELESIDSELNQ